MTIGIGDSFAIHNENEVDLKGRLATTLEDIMFFTGSGMAESGRKEYPAGTEIKLSYYQPVSDLYIFEFPGGFNFPIRAWKFTWKEETNGNL
jgi:hypothetical protein